MSQSIVIKGIFKNNKQKGVGAHNPKNNRFFNDDEIKHLEKMMIENIEPNYNRFKEIEVIMDLEGKRIFKGRYKVDDFSKYDSKIIVCELLELFKFYEKKQLKEMC